MHTLTPISCVPLICIWIQLVLPLPVARISIAQKYIRARGFVRKGMPVISCMSSIWAVSAVYCQAWKHHIDICIYLPLMLNPPCVWQVSFSQSEKAAAAGWAVWAEQYCIFYLQSLRYWVKVRAAAGDAESGAEDLDALPCVRLLPDTVFPTSLRHVCTQMSSNGNCYCSFEDLMPESSPLLSSLYAQT